ncbi:hypothetical protein A374_05431 [Fictibacillus macauensis ZFHKF-1]|uniref:L-2,4-diaminobutyrate decarboxylase n=1 Tax=Fictibacillus macauensis ZFHKF-1 TaxID=1196324 RepID=I8UHJ6_9BACL|nr:aspartate aminotransferase family protein [Fictibacillus macauensis]EIT86380.1 hypothetical protein A374_05431 [Fictibacillus macauensis ZFHKF-1]
MSTNTTATLPYEKWFLHEGQEGLRAYYESVAAAVDVVSAVTERMKAPYHGASPEQVAEEVNRLSLPEAKETALHQVLAELTPLLAHNIHVNHTHCMAHLHCPPLLPSLAGEMLISAFNQSMDSWDQSAAATYIEEKIIAWLTSLYGLGQTSDGTFTSGGTQSNYMGLLLARDAYCEKTWNHNVQRDGLPKEAGTMRILCSKAAHFTVLKSASQLGLGERSVVLVETDEKQRLSLTDLQVKLAQLQKENLSPFAIVGTCGTTDFGSIDPLEELAAFAEAHDLWFHVDAAYGGALAFSKEGARKIQGIQFADSLSIDFHKLFYQPISCGAFFVKNAAHFRYVTFHADYLNPEMDEEDGLVHLVNKSIQTTRRFDALKLYLSLRTMGLETFGEMIDDTLQVARRFATELDLSPDFVVVNKEPEISAVVFRYEPKGDYARDEMTKEIHHQLFYESKAVIAKTTYEGSLYLKVTLLNPRITMEALRALLDDIERIGQNFIQRGGNGRD